MTTGTKIHRIALITGATSGIGKCFAFELARQNYDLILTGRRHDVLNQVANTLRKTYTVSVSVFIVDFTDTPQVAKFLQSIEDNQDIEILINNAGYGLGKAFHHHDVTDQLKMIQVHIEVPLQIIHRIIPLMMNRKKGIIINVGSLAAFIPAITNIMYSGTKAFLLNFSESLNLTLKRHGIKIQYLCPGLTMTDFHARLSSPPDQRKKSLFYNWMKPEMVVQYSLRHLNNGKVLCIPGFKNRLTLFLLACAPRRLYYYVTEKLQNKSVSSDIPLQSKGTSPSKVLIN